MAGTLVLSRYRDQIVQIGDDIEVQVVSVRGDLVRLGIRAPKHIRIDRQEVLQKRRHEEALRAGGGATVVRELARFIGERGK